MLYTAVASLLFASATLAQTSSTPAQFPIQVNKTLDVFYGTQSITPPGLLVKKSSTSKQPTIGLTDITPSGKYLLAMIDIDLQGSGGSTKRGTVLHALLQDWTATGQTQGTSNLLSTKATGPASYFGPAPPAENPKHPHNYVFILHQQPDGFAVPAAHKSAVSGRMNIDWVKFIADAKLGEPIAANYLQVQSGDNTKRFEFQA